MPEAKFEHSFDRPSADVILRSSDNVDFRVHKLILSEASPVFESMFTLPGNDADLPVIPISEPPTALHAVLGVLYPGKGLLIASVTEAGTVLALADKYAMDGAFKQVESILANSAFIKDWGSALTVYALARRYGFNGVAGRAATQSLQYIVFIPASSKAQLSVITASAYHDLMNYRDCCGQLIYDRFEDGWEEAVDYIWDQDIFEMERFANNKDHGLPLKDRCVNCPSLFWFHYHLLAIKGAFIRRPCRDSITEISLIDDTVALIKCQGCKAKAPLFLIEFCRRLAVFLDDDIDCVSFLSNYANA